MSCSTSGTYPSLSADGTKTYYETISLALQALFYGVSVVLILFSTRVLLRRELESRRRMLLLSAMFAPFIVSTAYWLLEVVQEMARLQIMFIDRYLRQSHTVACYEDLIDDISFINYFFVDAVVVWRAWTLCGTEYRKTCILSTFLLSLMALSFFAIIAVRVTLMLYEPNNLLLLISISWIEYIYGIWSLLTNICTTAIISYKAWRYRKVLRKDFSNTKGRTGKAARLLDIFIETGAIYILISVSIIATSSIPLRSGTLGDIFNPMNVQLAGIFPTMVIYLVGLQRTMDNTTFQDQDPTTTTSLRDGQLTSVVINTLGTASDVCQTGERRV